MSPGRNDQGFTMIEVIIGVFIVALVASTFALVLGAATTTRLHAGNEQTEASFGEAILQELEANKSWIDCKGDECDGRRSCTAARFSTTECVVDREWWASAVPGQTRFSALVAARATLSRGDGTGSADHDSSQSDFYNVTVCVFPAGWDVKYRFDASSCRRANLRTGSGKPPSGGAAGRLMVLKATVAPAESRSGYILGQMCVVTPQVDENLDLGVCRSVNDVFHPSEEPCSESSWRVHSGRFMLNPFTGRTYQREEYRVACAAYEYFEGWKGPIPSGTRSLTGGHTNNTARYLTGASSHRGSLRAMGVDCDGPGGVCSSKKKSKKYAYAEFYRCTEFNGSACSTWKLEFKGKPPVIKQWNIDHGGPTPNWSGYVGGVNSGQIPHPAGLYKMKTFVSDEYAPWQTKAYPKFEDDDTNPDNRLKLVRCGSGCGYAVQIFRVEPGERTRLVAAFKPRPRTLTLDLKTQPCYNDTASDTPICIHDRDHYRHTPDERHSENRWADFAHHWGGFWIRPLPVPFDRSEWRLARTYPNDTARRAAGWAYIKPGDGVAKFIVDPGLYSTEFLIDDWRRSPGLPPYTMRALVSSGKGPTERDTDAARGGHPTDGKFANGYRWFTLATCLDRATVCRDVRDYEPPDQQYDRRSLDYDADWTFLWHSNRGPSFSLPKGLGRNVGTTYDPLYLYMPRCRVTQRDDLTLVSNPSDADRERANIGDAHYPANARADNQSKCDQRYPNPARGQTWAPGCDANGPKLWRNNVNIGYRSWMNGTGACGQLWAPDTSLQGAG